MKNEMHQEVVRKIGGPYGRVLAKFDKGGRIGVRARKLVANLLGCRETDLLKYLKHRHLYPAMSALETTDQMIVRGVETEQNIGRQDHQVVAKFTGKGTGFEYQGNFCPIAYVQRLRDAGKGHVLGLPSRFVTGPSAKFMSRMSGGR